MTGDMLDQNRASWNSAAATFHGYSLPDWGGFGVSEQYPDLLGPIDGRTFVEIGCGSGHSINYLIERGAAHVTGIDLSDTQIMFARSANAAALEQGRVTLIHAPMEERVELEPVDTAFSAFAIGWTVDLARTLSNVYAYLKPGGRFVWSWQHPFHYIVRHKGEDFVIVRSYFDEEPHQFGEWQHDPPIYITNRRVSTWFQTLRKVGFDVLDIIEPQPTVFEPKRDDPARFTSNPKAKIVPPLMIFVCQKPS